MATKANPGPHDCYAKAEDDEPMFILLGRDPEAPALVRRWAARAEKQGAEKAKIQEALDCAEDMMLFRSEREARIARTEHQKARAARDARTDAKDAAAVTTAEKKEMERQRT